MDTMEEIKGFKESSSRGAVALEGERYTTSCASPAGGQRKGARRSGTLRYLLWMTVVVALSAGLLLLIIWSRRAFEDAVIAWGRQMPVIAVLGDDVSEADAQSLAEQLRREIPALECVVISRQEARSILALQEPWMKQLPDVMAGELPLTLEIRHPALFHSPGELDEFLASLRTRKGIDFVIFNSLGHEKVVEALTVVRRHANVLVVSVCAVILILLAAIHHQLVLCRGNTSFGKAFAFGFGISTVGGAIGYAIFLCIANCSLSASFQVGALNASFVLLCWIILFGLISLLELLHMPALQSSRREE